MSVCLVLMKNILHRSIRHVFSVYVIVFIIMFNSLDIIHAAETKHNIHEDGFYSYVLKKGISIQNITKDEYVISHKRWHCNIDTSVAKNFTKRNISWTDVFETNLDVLAKKTVFSHEQLRHKLGVLPKDGTPVTIVARQGNASIPEENVIIRLNRHGPLNARTTMVITLAHPVKTVTMSARNQPNQEIIHWMHYYKGQGKVSDHGLWNTSHPLVIPQEVWNLENLTYYRGPLFFMKGKNSIGNFAKCFFRDFIGLTALNRLIHLKGTITTLGFSTNADEYNTRSEKRFHYLAHKLAWSYYVVKELTDIIEISNYSGYSIHTQRAEKVSTTLYKDIIESGSIVIYLTEIVIMFILFLTIKCRKLIRKMYICLCIHSKRIYYVVLSCFIILFLQFSMITVKQNMDQKSN